MTTTEHPITRSELREELNELRGEFRERYATKVDLAELKAALRGDLNKVIIGLASLQLIGLGAVAAIMGFLA